VCWLLGRRWDRESDLVRGILGETASSGLERTQRRSACGVVTSFFF
jgi:hypothetical protein